MKPYSSLFFAQGQYRPITADSLQGVYRALVEFAIDQLVEPVGVYNALTDRFTYYATSMARRLTLAGDPKRSTPDEIRLNLERLRKTEHRPDLINCLVLEDSSG